MGDVMRMEFRTPGMAVAIAVVVASIGCEERDVSGEQLIDCEGDVAISSDADLEEARRCRTISGVLSISGGDVHLPALERVGGIDASAALGVSLPRLQGVDASVEIWSQGDVSLPLLDSIGGCGDLYSACVSLDLYAPKGVVTLGPLSQCAGILSVSGAAAVIAPGLVGPVECHLSHVSDVSLPALKAGTFFLGGAIRSLRAPVLAHAYGLRVETTHLSLLELPELVHVSRSPRYEDPMVFEVEYTTALAEIHLPKLESAQELVIEGNEALTDAHLPALRTVERKFIIGDNTRLPNCQATAIRAQLLNAPAMTRIHGNDDAATCD